ncbi:MAG: hypothetical protein EZS28_045528 [Streblomastix strix]|uniref:Uncharacterized protein n=1 Tax=Streblomastix strix TaxID=222440 RepID=A0A5J4TNC8_9EUKA|nr:MAG: hypothetical protein EZS28_045528 [Streblomastix strix]
MGGFPYRIVPTKREKPCLIVGYDCDRGLTQSWVYDVVKQHTDQVASDGAQPNHVFSTTIEDLTQDIEFAGTYIFTSQTDNDNSNGLPSALKEPDSHIEKVVIDYDTILHGAIALPTSHYTIKNLFNDILLPIGCVGSIDGVNNKFYEIFDGVNQFIVVNVHVQSFRYNEKIVQIGSLLIDLQSDLPLYFLLTCLYEKENFKIRPPAGYTAIGVESNKQ